MVTNNTLCTVSHTNREIDEDRKNEVKLGQKIHNFSHTNKLATMTTECQPILRVQNLVPSIGQGG